MSPESNGEPPAAATADPTPSTAPHPRRPPGNATVYQTTGPEAYTGPIPAPDGSGPQLNPRSCVTCRRRKVRCDKQMPCSNCRRALIPCVFPAPGRAPRQPRPRDPNAPPRPSSQREAELVKRLRKLEGIVEELSTQLEVESAGKGGGGGAGSSAAGDSPANNNNNNSNSNNSPATGVGPKPRLPRVNSGTVAGSSSYTGLGASWDQDDSQAGSGDGSGRIEPHAQLGRLVLNDHKGNTRYISNGFWIKLNDELAALREDTHKLSNSDSDESDYEESPNDETPPDQPEDAANDHHAFLFGYRSADVDLRSFHPQPPQVPLLWSVYLENVESILKLLHVPTVEPLMRDARKQPEKLTAAQEALVFAIYFAAVVSLGADEAQANLGASRDELLRQYRFALEQSLARAGFIGTSDVVVLQALVMFILTARSVDHSRFCWTMTSLVIRIAKGMGLHRDGSLFDLTPFETEVRRRVWWAILMLDLRSTEELGTELSITDGSFDTRPPLNINDADISPESTHPPAPREGRTDISLVLARCEIAIFARRYLACIFSSRDWAGPLSAGAPGTLDPDEMEQSLMEVHRSVQERFFNRAGGDKSSDPQNYTVGLICRVIVAKMALHLYQSRMFPGAKTMLSDDIRDRVYAVAVEVVEVSRKLGTDPCCEQFHWLFSSYTNWHAIAFNLIEICRRPWSPMVERSWQAVAAFERDPVDLARTGDRSVIFLPLRKLYLRARRHRDAEVARLRGDLDAVRRLDFEFQSNQSYTRFAPAPAQDPDHPSPSVRDAWWRLVQPDADRSALMDSDAMDEGDSQTPPAESLGQQPTNTPATSSSNAPGAVPQPELTSEAVEMLEAMLAQPSNPVINTLYGLNIPAPSAAAAMGPPPALGSGSHPDDDSSLRRQALALQAQAAASAPGNARVPDHPAFLWSQPFDTGRTPGGTAAASSAAAAATAADQDMMDGEFNWQDWSQSLHMFDTMGQPFGTGFP